MIKNVALSTILLVIMAVCSPDTSAQDSKSKEKPSETPLVELTTSYGVIKIKLSDLTPKHRDNFLKLARAGFYDSLLFHRVISNFMIQGGDPESKHAEAGKMLGNGDVGYTIPAEFNDALYHKKGALCAARTENPEKASSGCQFYIVQGSKFTDNDLSMTEERINQTRKQSGLAKLFADPKNADKRARFMELRNNKQTDSLNIYYKTELEPLLAKEAAPFKYTEEQKKSYTTTGGTPHLDQGYTVFGEVVEGLDVIDQIAATKTATGDRPLEDVRMTVRVLEKK